MYKCNLTTSKLLYNLSLGLLAIFLITSCGNHQAEVNAIEQLETRIESNAKNLEIDDALFASRIQYIQKVLTYFSNEYSSKISLELGNNIEKLKVLKKVYTKNLASHNKNVNEQKQLTLQLSTLKNDVENGAMSKEEFKNYFNTEKIDTEVLINSSKSVKKSLYEVEPEYGRIIKTLEPLLPQDLR